jgi:hypothetical protein
MNTIFNYIEQHPQETVRLIGLSYEQFKDVVIQAELQHQHQITEQEKTKIRLNNQGGGRQRHLSVREEILSKLELLVDSYEQPRERPKDNQEQKKYYSGKKKITPSKIKSSRCRKEKT